MSVRKRQWFTKSQLGLIDPHAQKLAEADGRRDAWKTYREEAAAKLGLEPQQAWIAHYLDQDGAQRIATFARKRDADDHHAKVRTELGKGTHVAPSKAATVAEAAESWIKRVEANGMRDDGPAERSTIRQYRQHIDLHIKPRLGATNLAKLTPKDVEAFRDQLLDDLSRPLARKVLTSLKSILKVAKYGHVAADVSIGRDKRQEHKLEAGRDFPTPQEVKRLINATTSIKHRALLLTAALTGLRASELRGLRWSDVDFKHAEVHVRQRADRFNKIGAPKSVSSRRTVDLPPEAVSALKGWRLACPKGEADLVFPSSTGAIEHHKNALRSMEPLMKSAGLVDRFGKPKYGLHALRHFFASWCINPKNRGGREKPAKEVQELLGHSSIVLTMDVYGHLFPRDKDKSELAASSKALLS